jgi:hypothetical protein
MTAHCVAGERHRSGKMKPVRYRHNYGIPGDDCDFADLQAQLALLEFCAFPSLSDVRTWRPIFDYWHCH